MTTRPVLHRAQPLTEQDKRMLRIRRGRRVSMHRPITIDEIEARLSGPPRHLHIGASPPIHWAEMAVCALVAAFIGAALAMGGL